MRCRPHFGASFHPVRDGHVHAVRLEQRLPALVAHGALGQHDGHDLAAGDRLALFVLGLERPERVCAGRQVWYSLCGPARAVGRGGVGNEGGPSEELTVRHDLAGVGQGALQQRLPVELEAEALGVHLELDVPAPHLQGGASRDPPQRVQSWAIIHTLATSSVTLL